ncbi:VWA domain-containing protein [Nocardia sp. NPDC019395]|uniref:nitric oxide reductase activation protein NorD n=1 Tax=Nocardia sp. NPDC019395 TaxID=3154686 RepID=UPI0033DDB3F3
MSTDDETTGDSPDGLAILASAIAGRSLQVAYAPSGEPTWTDGHCIYLDPAAPLPQQRQSLALHASVIAGGGLDPGIMRSLGRRTSLAARYLAVEGHRALFANESVLPREALLSADRAVAAMSDSAETSREIASTRAQLPAAPPIFGVVRPRSVLSTHSSAEQTDAAAAHRPRSRRSSDLEVRSDDDTVEDDLPDLFSSPIGGGSRLGKWLQKLLGASRKAGGNGSPGAESAGYLGRQGTRGAGAVASGASAEAPDSADTAGPHTYPEWDVHRRRYRREWCSVVETEPDANADLWMPHWDRTSLRQPLARIATAPALFRRQPQGDDLDIDAVVEARVDVLSGSSPDETVYLDTLRRRRDLSVLILLDISGSVAEPGGGGKPVHDQQRAAAATLISALHELGDRVALYAFRSQGRSAVHVVPVKRFDDRLGTRVLQRLHGLVPAAYSRLGAAIRHGTSVLRTDGGTSRRLLLVLSDGLAYDHGYERAYGAADARRALAEARREGIGCLCLTIGAHTGDTDLTTVFGSAAHVTIPDTDHLPGVVGPLFRSALRATRTRTARRPGPAG